MAINNIEHDYLKLLYDVFKNGELKEGRNGKTRSVFGRQIRHDMKLGFPLLTTKKMYWKGIVTELLWFLRGDTNIKFLVDNGCHIWDGDAYKQYVDSHEVRWPKSKEDFIEHIKTDTEFAKKWGDLGPVYGKQWRSWGRKGKYVVNEDLKFSNGTFTEIDQLANLINDLKTNPDSRRLMVNAWNVGELDQMVLPPCHYGFQVYTRELSSGERRDWVIKNRSQQMPKFFDRLGWEGNVDKVLEEFNAPTRAISLMWNQRSADVFLGLPFNIASYGLLLEIIAKAVNMVPDELVGNIGDAHLYLNHIEQAKKQMHRELYPLPKLMFKDHLKDFDSIIDILRINDFILDGYESHPTIKAPLSN
jgi:thymidylate synthase